ncbi:MAG: hypothetical protein Q8Q39_02475 [bacterium]|nr:hypothetical protein [bacterium]
MPTIINNPPGSGDSGGSAGLIIGILVIIVIVALFFIYALPAIRENSGTDINIPEKIEIDVNGTQ